MSTTTSQTKPMSDSNEINTLLELRKIFHTETLMMTLHLHNTREKMMNDQIIENESIVYRPKGEDLKMNFEIDKNSSNEELTFSLMK